MERDFEKYLTKDTASMIAMDLDPKTLLNLCATNRRFFGWVCNDQVFWQKKTTKDYPLLLGFKAGGTWKDFYLNIMRNIAIMSEEYGFDYLNYVLNTPGYLSPRDKLRDLKTQRDNVMKSYLGKDVAQHLNKFYKK